MAHLLETRFTRRFGIDLPIVLAPMDPASGGALAGAVSAAGGLGLIGGGYAETERLEREFPLAGNHKVGCGFITWALAGNPGLLDVALAHKPAALMLSFADPAPFAGAIKAAGVPLICQVQTLEHARRALDVGADVIVAQGTEAGGHGQAARSTLPFVPAVADLIAARAPDCLLLAAGGIADGRGLAAVLMLGADGALMGSRFWATREALIHPNAQAMAVAADGDDTVRTRVYDIVRQKAWPAAYTGRLLRNGFISRWHGREEALEGLKEEEMRQVEAALEEGDFDMANVTVGEAIGLVRDVPPAGDLVRRIAAEAQACLTRFAA